MRRTWLAGASALLICSAIARAGPGAGEFAETPQHAVDTAKEWLAQHPNDAEAHLFVGEMYKLLWAWGPKIPQRDPLKVLVADPMGFPYFRAGLRISCRRSSEQAVTPGDVAALLTGITELQKAIALKSNAKAHLGLGSALWDAQRFGIAVPTEFLGTEGPPLTATETAAFAVAIRDLDATEFAVREAASRRLEEALPRCADMLRNAAVTDTEAAARISMLLNKRLLLAVLEHLRAGHDLAETELDAIQSFKEPVISPRQNEAGCLAMESAECLYLFLKENPSLAQPGELEMLAKAKESRGLANGMVVY